MKGLRRAVRLSWGRRSRPNGPPLGQRRLAYKKYEKLVEGGFVRAAKFLHRLHIFRVFDLPYQSQVVPLAAILADLGDACEHETTHAKIVRWYWNAVFGELYG